MKPKIINLTLFMVLLMTAPLLVFGAPPSFKDLLFTGEGILRFFINFFMILATVIFLWGVITYITAGGVEEKIKEGRTYMLWGLVGLFVMVAVWGLVAVIGATFPGVNSTNTIPGGPQ